MPLVGRMGRTVMREFRKLVSVRTNRFDPCILRLHNAASQRLLIQPFWQPVAPADRSATNTLWVVSFWHRGGREDARRDSGGFG